MQKEQEIMNLSMIIFLIAFSFLLNGGLLIAKRKQYFDFIKIFLRSQKYAILTFGSGGIWFLYKITQLGESNFGEYKHILFFAFFFIIILSFKFLKDFLSVRGLCVLLLQIAQFVFNQTDIFQFFGRSFLIFTLYFVIILSLYFASLPYKLRDFSNWLFEKEARAQILGFFMLSIGIWFIFTGINFSLHNH